jgi:hypothetical protein
MIIIRLYLFGHFNLLEREPALNELAEIKKYFLLIFPDSVYQLA